ncbi:MAG: transporter substrate-binding domain-containing protein [Desulfomonilia bacterium]|nr:transporter substrate-binding domain-containing protein [Desulfomonilia bacterium]
MKGSVAGFLGLFLILACCFLPSPAHAGGNMVFAVNANWPPMQMKEHGGTIIGYEIDMINALAEAEGFRIKIVDVPWSTIFRGLNEGLYDAVLASVSITKARGARFDFSDPYFSAKQVLIIRKNQALEPLYGKEIGVFKLTTGAETLRAAHRCKMTYYSVDEIEKAFSHLARGDLLGILLDSPVAHAYTFSRKRFLEMFTIAADMPEGCTDLPSEEYGIVVKKGNTEVLDILNRGLRSFRDSTIEAQLRQKWFSAQPETVITGE